jgi:imidazolonepropionase
LPARHAGRPSDYGIVEDAALAWRDGRIAWLGPRAALPGPPAALAREVREAGGDWITPALVDCHTHLVFGGNRAVEAERRLQGASYEQIAREGGGIVSTVRATRALDEDGLYAASLPRAAALVADGVGTIEIKSGYGLDFDSEARMLRVARRLGAALGVEVRTTFLGAHALPPEFAGRADDYVEAACGWLRELHAQGWWMRSTPSARASASARRRRGACSRPRASSACR